jgi:hypothetical protein
MASCHINKPIESSVRKVFEAEITSDYENRISCHNKIIFVQLILPQFSDEARQRPSIGIIQNVTRVTIVFRKGADHD